LRDFIPTRWDDSFSAQPVGIGLGYFALSGLMDC
jgi:hypothetical protein